MTNGFLPPMPEIPQNVGNGDPSAVLSGPQQANVPANYERQRQQAVFVQKTQNIRASTNSVIRTRSDFKQYLNQNGLDLVTSAVEFQHTGDFILSSYVIYLNHGNYQEPLVSFLQRYPQLQQPVMAIRDRLRPAQSGMQVSTPNPYNFGL